MEVRKIEIENLQYFTPVLLLLRKLSSLSWEVVVPDMENSVSSIPAEEIRAVLQDILRSSAFGMSKRCGDFLAYVVEETLAGRQQELKERMIGAAVFGRTPAYDTNEDAIVRIKASEVRKRLGYYYAQAGEMTQVRITLPAGRYVPFFARTESHSGPGSKNESTARKSGEKISEINPAFVPAETDLQPESQSSSGRRFIGLAILLLAILSFLALIFYRQQSSPLAKFWKPVLQNSSPVYLLTAPAPVYLDYPSTKSSSSRQAAKEYVLTTDQFVGQGDLLAFDHIASMLRSMKHPYAIKMSNNVDFHDLSQHPVVLIGYSSTEWQAISKDFRFFIDDSNEGMITDRGRPTEWYPHHLTKDLHTEDDYAILSRVYDPQTRAIMVLVSGSTQYGTEGAAEVVTNDELLREILRNAPQGWDKKNLQVVLHMKIIANAPATPNAIAFYTW